MRWGTQVHVAAGYHEPLGIKMKNSETTIYGELHTHKLLWSCCSQQVEAAEDALKRSNSSHHFELSAMLLAYLTLESYVNFLGDRLAPEIWKIERDFFNKHPYKGMSGKLKKIFEIIEVDEPNKGKRPYQTIQKLKQLRDYLSHGKPDKYTKVVIHHKDEAPPLFHSKLDTLASPKSLTTCYAGGQ